MAYYSNCSAGSSNYSVSTPSVKYSLGDNSVSYSVAVDSPQSMYQGTGNYSLPAVIAEKKDSPIYNSSSAFLPAKRAEVMPSFIEKNMPGNQMDRIIEDFFPKKHINPAVDEIERALANVIKMEQFEIEEEIIIRRKVVKKSVTLDSKKRIF